MKHSLSVDHFIQRLKNTPLTDRRRGTNTRYAVSDALLAAFSIFFMQCESFLEGERELEKLQERNNAQTVFGMGKIPTIPQACNLLDPVEPSELDELFRYALEELEASGHLEPMRVLDDRLLIGQCCPDSTRLWAFSTFATFPLCDITGIGWVSLNDELLYPRQFRTVCRKGVAFCFKIAKFGIAGLPPIHLY